MQPERGVGHRRVQQPFGDYREASFDRQLRSVFVAGCCGQAGTVADIQCLRVGGFGHRTPRGARAVRANEVATSGSNRHQANHRLGPAFWSKLFYFARYQLRLPEVQPLILDANVARALRARTKESWGLPAWSSRQYLDYCQMVRDWADEQGAEPHDIEFELSRQG